MPRTRPSDAEIRRAASEDVRRTLAVNFGELSLVLAQTGNASALDDPRMEPLVQAVGSVLTPELSAQTQLETEL